MAARPLAPRQSISAAVVKRGVIPVVGAAAVKAQAFMQRFSVPGNQPRLKAPGTTIPAAPRPVVPRPLAPAALASMVVPGTAQSQDLFASQESSPSPPRVSSPAVVASLLQSSSSDFTGKDLLNSSTTRPSSEDSSWTSDGLV